MPDTWPDQLTRQWAVEIGDGYATPLVVGDFIYTFTRRDGDEVMSALNASTGDALWSNGLPGTVYGSRQMTRSTATHSGIRTGAGYRFGPIAVDNRRCSGRQPMAPAQPNAC